MFTEADCVEEGPSIPARSAGPCPQHGYSSAPHVCFKSRPFEEISSKKDRNYEGDGLPPTVRGVGWGGMRSFSFLYSPGGCDELAMLRGVEENVVGLVRLCLFHVLTEKEMLK